MNIYLREEWKKFNILTIKEMIVSYKRKFSKSHNSCKAFLCAVIATRIEAK